MSKVAEGCLLMANRLRRAVTLGAPDLMSEAADVLEDAAYSYEGARDDCDSAVMVLIKRITGASDMDSAREWVCLNYPSLAFANDLMDAAQRAHFIAKQAVGADPSKDRSE